MSYPKISIITPSYNQGQYIEETIVSVIEQGYPNLEYIIIDGGSTDNTVEIIKKYESYITYWVSEKDNGQSDAINKGFQLATGEIINWLNSDDYYEPGTLHHVAAQFVDPKVSCYCGTSRIFGGEKERFSTGTDIYPANLSKTIGWARIDQPESFFRKPVLDSIGYLNEGLHYVMDKDLWIRYLCLEGLTHIKKDSRLLVHFRLHGESKTVSLKEKFREETQNLFYTYTNINKAVLPANLWTPAISCKEIPLYYKPQQLNMVEWEKITNYFLLLQGLEYYAENNIKAAKQILTAVNKEALDTADQRKLSNVLRRINYLPLGLKKLINRIRS